MTAMKAPRSHVWGLVAALLCLLTVVSAVTEISGKIVSCGGCQLNRYPGLRSFLKDSEAEEYRNVEVQFIAGRRAVLSIYFNDELLEEIDLFDFVEENSRGKNEKEELHKLMAVSGFVRRPPEEIARMKATRREGSEAEAKRRMGEHEKRRRDREAQVLAKLEASRAARGLPA